jgi:hypothetical protein
VWTHLALYSEPKKKVIWAEEDTKFAFLNPSHLDKVLLFGNALLARSHPTLIATMSAELRPLVTMRLERKKILGDDGGVAGHRSFHFHTAFLSPFILHCVCNL